MSVRSTAIAILLAFALYYTYGQFSSSWMTVLPLVMALSIFSLPASTWFTRHVETLVLVAVVFFFGVGAVSLLPDAPGLRSMIVDVGDYRYMPLMRVLLALAAGATVALFFATRSSKDRAERIFFLLIVGLATAAAALIVPTSPSAQIDVWTLHEQAADAFIHFRNPYTVDYVNIYPKELWPALTPFGVNFAYLPGVFIWMAPWKALGLDTRFSQVFAYALTSILLFLTARHVCGRKSFVTYAPALLFLSFPLTTFFIVRGWNDDITVLFFALAAYAMVARRPRLLFVACNALFLLKQYSIVFVPLLIWHAARSLKQGWLKSVLASTFVAVAVGAGYLIADWRNFLGSLYGLHFLKHPDVHQVFPDRTDPYSLMNWLHLYTGLKLSWLFLIPVAAIAWRVVRANRLGPSAASLLRGLVAMSFAMFIFAPIAFANYYEFALGLTLIAMAVSLSDEATVEAVSWEFKTDAWCLGWIATRALILFTFSELIIETRVFASVADFVEAGQTPYFDFNFHHLPFALIPAVLPAWLKSFGDKSDFVSYHTLFQLVILACDALLASAVFRAFRARRISKVALAIYIFGPLLIAPIYLTNPTLVSIIGIGAVAAGASQLRPVKELARRWSRHPRSAILFSFAVLTLGAAATLLSAWYFDLEIQIDALLSPTHVLIWMMAGIGCGIGRSFSGVDITKNRVFVAAFLASLVLSGVLFLNIESVFNQDSPLAGIVWIRNSLAAFSVILWGWSISHSSPQSRLE